MQHDPFPRTKTDQSIHMAAPSLKNVGAASSRGSRPWSPPGHHLVRQLQPAESSVATLNTLMTSLHLSLEKRLLATMPGSLHDAQTQQWLAMAKTGMRAGIRKSGFVLPRVRPTSSPAYPAHRTVTVTLQAVACSPFETTTCSSEAGAPVRPCTSAPLCPTQRVSHEQSKRNVAAWREELKRRFEEDRTSAGV